MFKKYNLICVRLMWPGSCQCVSVAPLVTRLEMHNQNMEILLVKNSKTNSICPCVINLVIYIYILLNFYIVIFFSNVPMCKNWTKCPGIATFPHFPASSVCPYVRLREAILRKKSAYFWTFSKSGLDPPPPPLFWTPLG